MRAASSRGTTHAHARCLGALPWAIPLEVWAALCRSPQGHATTPAVVFHTTLKFAPRALTDAGMQRLDAGGGGA